MVIITSDVRGLETLRNILDAPNFEGWGHGLNSGLCLCLTLGSRPSLVTSVCVSVCAHVAGPLWAQFLVHGGRVFVGWWCLVAGYRETTSDWLK